MLGNGEILIRQAGEQVLCQWQCDKGVWQRGIGEKHSSAKPICEQGNHLYDLIFDCSLSINGYADEAKLKVLFFLFLPLSPPGWRGIVVTVRAAGRAGGRAGGLAGGRAGGRAGGCQTCGTHISVTAWWIFSVRSSMELSRPVVVHCHAHLPICSIWACPWAKNLSNLPQIGSRLCGSHISETAGWIYPI